MAQPGVLIIEDHPEVREALAGALSTSGLDVTVAVDGLDGLKRLEAAAELPAVILLDLRMPRLGAEAFLERVRADARWGTIPVITMSAGMTCPGDRGVRAHLHEPFELADLTRIVMSLV